MTGEYIKQELTDLGIKLKDLAAELNVSKTSISLVIHKKSVSDRVQRAIAGKLGRDPEDVFPEYYRHRRQITKPEEGEKARGNP